MTGQGRGCIEICEFGFSAQFILGLLLGSQLISAIFFPTVGASDARRTLMVELEPTLQLMGS